jgi:Xaa-Pro aminopeptidase
MVAAREIQEKKQRVRSLMQELDLAAIYIKRQSNFAWLTAGGSNTVGITLELGVAGLLITNTRDFAICCNIEAPRMEKEERLEEQGYSIQPFPWYEDCEADLVRRLAGEGRFGADHAMPGAVDVSRSISALRYSLTPEELERYREVGALAARAIEETALSVRPGAKECEIVGELVARLWRDRLDYITTFCAADERIALYRHPIATENPVRERAMLCVNARKYGLIVSLTRFVQFGRVPPRLRTIYGANVRIDCTLMAYTVPGRPVVEAFLKGVETYRETGYPDEYRLHHQGGAIGYVGRDYKVDFRSEEIVRENQAFAWNPSITGSKSEDTMIATNSGPLIVSGPVLFPCLTVEVAGRSFQRPDILEV